jgi:hypothetical protein
MSKLGDRELSVEARRALEYYKTIGALALTMPQDSMTARMAKALLRKKTCACGRTIIMMGLASHHFEWKIEPGMTLLCSDCECGSTITVEV